MKISESSIPFRLRAALAVSTAVLLCSVAFGCSTGAGPGGGNGSPDAASPVLDPVQSGFLTNYTKLKATEQFADVKMYRDDAHLKGDFRKVLFRPVQVWRGADHKLEENPASDLQYLADAFYSRPQGSHPPNRNRVSSRLTKRNVTAGDALGELP